MDNKNLTKNNLEPDYYVVEFKKRRFDYFSDRNKLALACKDYVMVQAERGRDMGKIFRKTTKTDFETNSQHKYPLEILRKALDDELDKLESLRAAENEVIITTKELIDFRGLKMKLVDAEYQFDGNKLTIFFTADERVDFRELVKDLAASYRTRIELRQIGVRDEAKKIGGIGPCGVPICCATFLQDFAPVSTQMARSQSLAVNPSKISGLCERLMCCLIYELNYYERVEKEYPMPGDIVRFESGQQLTVVSIDHFGGTLRLKDDAAEDILQISITDFRKKLAGRKEFLKKYLAQKCPNKNGHS